MAKRREDGHDGARQALDEKLRQLPCTLCGEPLGRHRFRRDCLARRRRDERMDEQSECDDEL